VQDELEQFEISDHRPTDEFINVIKKQGYEPVWKDWDHSLQ
jgi:2-iminoacetate synthase